MTVKINWGNLTPQSVKQPKLEASASPIKIDWSKVKQPEGQSTLRHIGEALGGGLLGLAQGGADIGQHIAQAPFDLYSWYTGNPGFQTPKPDIREFGPRSSIGKRAEQLGEIASPFVLSPTVAAESALGGAMFGGKVIPRLLADMLGGAAESDTGHRQVGALLGLTSPLVGGARRKYRETPFTEAGAVKNINKARELAGSESLGLPVDLEFLRNLEYQMQSPFLKPSKMQLNTLIGEAAKGDYPSYYKFQSALGDIGRELTYPSQQKGKGILGMIGQYLAPPQSSAAERLTGQQLNQLRQDYINSVKEHLFKIGKGKVATLEEKGKKEYANYKKFAPLRNKIALGAAAASIPGIHWLKTLGGE